MVAREDLTGANDPLILTAKIDDQSFAFFDGMRRAHFPPARNLVPAHLTLFHSLPGDELRFVSSVLKQAAAGIGSVRGEIGSARSIGNGVAYEIDAPRLSALHRDLQQEFWHLLTPQDRQRFWPHITIQNKVTRSEADKLSRDLAKSETPRSLTITGLLLWRYCGGPWERVSHYPFKP